ncbi:hypothetical protein CH339_19305, partial [Rhodobium orientis]
MFALTAERGLRPLASAAAAHQRRRPFGLAIPLGSMAPAPNSAVIPDLVYVPGRWLTAFGEMVDTFGMDRRRRP